MPPRTPPRGLTGAAPAVRALEARLRRAAASDATVLLQGESGSGRTHAARLLHALSPRAKGPLLLVHPAALSASLLEAELFGHEAGAFTGASSARAGRFQRAKGGTLVLEGVEDLPLPLQVKLLRVLQEREVEPLGAEAPVPIDVRLVATARRSLLEEVASGRFREDLYYRLAVVEFTLPPLRERLADLPELIRALGEGLTGQPFTRPVAAEALERLRQHPWPGNLAELEALLQRLTVLGGPSDPVQVAELGDLAEATRTVAEELAARALAAGLTLSVLEQALLKDALRIHHGNASAAARALGISRKAFDYRSKQSEGAE